MVQDNKNGIREPKSNSASGSAPGFPAYVAIACSSPSLIQVWAVVLRIRALRFTSACVSNSKTIPHNANVGKSPDPFHMNALRHCSTFGHAWPDRQRQPLATQNCSIFPYTLPHPLLEDVPTYSLQDTLYNANSRWTSQRRPDRV